MDKYQKVKVLGKGSFGSAVLIKRKSDGQLLVVKEVNMLRMNNKEKEEARHEVKVLQKLQHPNITQFVERIERKGMLYIIMEYADGGDLHQKVEAAKRTRGFLKEELVLHYFSQLCLALDYLHTQHILHRDIKSMNVFLTSGGTVKLGDFGISTVLRNTLGMANTVCGTPYYFSPELCKNKPYNNKSDVWAMGIILYELVTLRHAFDGNSMQQLLQRITKGSFAPVPANVNPGIRDMITMCLQKDPSRRPTIKQLLMHDVMRSALSKLQADLDVAANQQKALREVIPRDPQVDDEAQRVLKAKLAGEKAARAMAEQQQKEQQQQKQPPPLQPLVGVKAGGNAGQMPPQPGRYAAYEQALANHRAGGAAPGNNKVPPPSSNPTPAPYGGAGANKAGAGGQNIDVKAVMGDLDMFLKHLGRPTDQIAKEALRREQAEKAHKDRARQAELEKEKLERDKQEKMRLWEERQKKERDRLKEAAARAKAYQADLDANLDKHRERMKAAQEKEKQRREELKKKIAQQEKKKEQARKRANSNAAANLAKERAAQEAREAERERLKQKAAEEQRAVLKANLRPQVDKVQNWAAKQNEKNRRELEEKRQKKLEEDRRAVQELDARGIPEKDMKHKVLDPELEAWVNREIKKNSSGDSAGTSNSNQQGSAAGGAASAANAKGKAQAEDLRQSIEKTELLFKERGEAKRGGRTSPQLAPLVAPSGAPHVPGLQLAANACGSPLSVRNKHRHNELPHMNQQHHQQPHSAKVGGMQRAQTNDPTAHALFPPAGLGADAKSRSEDNIGVGHLEPIAARGERKEPDPNMPEAFLAKPKLARSHSKSQPPEEIPQSLAPPQQQVRHLSPSSGLPMQGGPVAGRRMADRRPNAQIDKLSLQPDDLQKVTPKPTQPAAGVERKKSFGRREGREGSAPPVMRTPEANRKPMHLDASASDFIHSPSGSHLDGGGELDAESKMVGVEHIPTPVRQWMNEPMGNHDQKSKLSAAAGNSNTSAVSSNLAPPSNLSAQSGSSAGTGAHPHDRSRTLTPPRAIVQGGVGGPEEVIEEEITGGVHPAHPDPSIVIGAGGEEEIIEEVGEFENDRSESEDVDLNPIVEVQASSPQAVKKQQTEYSLMRSHIEDLLTASQLALSGVPQEESILDEAPSFVPGSARSERQQQPVPTTKTSSSSTTTGGVAASADAQAVPSASFLTPPKPITGLNHAPVTPPPRDEGVGPRRHSMSAKSFIEDEQFGDAEPITPSAIRKAVPGRRRPTVTPSDAKKVRKKSQRSIDRDAGSVDAMEETGLDNDDELEEVEPEDEVTSDSGASVESEGVTNTAGNTENTADEVEEDEAETALQRVAALCGEAFSADYPCHMDGSPLFESALERGKGHSVGHKTRQAELLREYLEEVLGLATLTSCYTIIGKLLEAPEPIPKGLNEKEGEEALMMSYTKHMGGVIGKATRIILDHLGDEAASDSLIDESVTLVAQLVYFDAEAFSHSN